MTSRRSGVWTLLAVAAVILVSTAPVWFTAEAGAGTVSVTGGRAAPGVAAGGVVVLAAALALALARRLGAALAAVVAAGGALLAGASAVGAVGRAEDLLAAAAADQAGVDAIAAVGVGPWPWVSAVVAAGGVVLAVVVGRSARGWTWVGARHEPVREGPTGGDAWDALSRGEDPT